MSLVLESCSTEELCIALGSHEKLLYQLRNELKDWMTLQPHLPQDVSDKRLEWMLISTKMSLDKAKRKLDMYYSIKQRVPEFFRNRDPRGPNITSLRNVMQFVPLPKLGPGNYKTVIFRLTETDSSKLCAWEIAKYVLMVADIRMVEGHCSGENLVGDLSMANLTHSMHLTPQFLKKGLTVAQKAYTSQIQGIHVINAAPFMDSLITTVKSFLDPKLAAKVHVHPAGDLERFYQFVPKSILPKDYGGDERSMAELDAECHKKVDEWRDWFLEHENIVVDERLRPGPAVIRDNIFGISGSFRKLEVD